MSDISEFKRKHNYVEYPINTCMDCIHSVWEADPDTNGNRRYCKLGEFETTDDSICDAYKE